MDYKIFGESFLNLEVMEPSVQFELVKELVRPELGWKDEISVHLDR